MKTLIKTTNCLPILVLALALLAGSCGKETEENTATDETKNTACDIKSFVVGSLKWDIDSLNNITHTYPLRTDGPLTPVITLSEGATVYPESGVAQNFFTEHGIIYTVTAKDGVTTKTYTVKATTGPYGTTGTCDILSFAVNGVEWNISDTSITYMYMENERITETSLLTPAITISPDASIDPPGDATQNFFTEAGVKYTVKAANGTDTRSYTAKAMIARLISSGATGACTWTLVGAPGNYILTIGGNGAMPDYSGDTPSPWYDYRESIRSVVIEDGVTNIGESAFVSFSNLESATLPNSVTRIGKVFNGSGIRSITIPNSVTTLSDLAFHSCTRLTTVTMGNSVTAIGYGTFLSCGNLTSISIGNSVTTIGEQAFLTCKNLTSISIPNSVTAIGRMAFSYCEKLSSITLGSSVTTLGPNIFAYSTALADIHVDSANPAFSSNNGALYNKAQTLLITCPPGKPGTYIIPSTVLEINAYAFSQCTNLTSIIIPNSVTTIGEAAFSTCTGLASIIIPNSVTTIGRAAFMNCENLTSISIPNSITAIGESAFSGCDNITDATIDLPNIAGTLFRNCKNLKFVTIGPSVITIAESAFYFCDQLLEVHFADNSRVTTIGTGAFETCGHLEEIIIPNSVTTIGVNAFSGCAGLEKVTVGSSVTSIGGKAFANCTKLTAFINYRVSPQAIGSNVFFNTPIANCTLSVPAASVDTYKAMDVWKTFKTISGID
ncbi:MAG: leucine-rich repeat protein [Prevotellaceae bacterium]|jgi:hypothetical protein|nr:leucine-rich repeat protein [Prevotellaceae bacterium]